MEKGDIACIACDRGHGAFIAIDDHEIQCKGCH